MAKQSYNLAIIFYSLSKLVCKINHHLLFLVEISLQTKFFLTRVAFVACFAWRMMTSRHYRNRASIACRRVATKKVQVRYTKSMPSGISRPTIAHKTRLWAGVAIVIQSQINLPAIPCGYDKKISLPRYVLRSSAIRQCLSHVLAY